MASFKENDDLYICVRWQMWFSAEKRPMSSLFRKKKDLSVDWSRLCSAQETRLRLNDENAGVASFKVGLAWSLEQEVIHDPIPANRAHTLIRGEKSVKVAQRFALACMVLVEPVEIPHR